MCGCWSGVVWRRQLRKPPTEKLEDLVYRRRRECTYSNREVERKRNTSKVGGREWQPLLRDQMAYCSVRSAISPPNGKTLVDSAAASRDKTGRLCHAPNWQAVIDGGDGGHARPTMLKEQKGWAMLTIDDGAHHDSPRAQEQRRAHRPSDHSLA